MREQIVALRVRYDPKESDRPALWDWTELAGDMCSVIAEGRIEEVSDD